jgi:hypothetical protein
MNGFARKPVSISPDLGQGEINASEIRHREGWKAKILRA